MSQWPKNHFEQCMFDAFPRASPSHVMVHKVNILEHSFTVSMLDI